MKASWKRGSKFSANAEKVYNEIERLRQKNAGSVLPVHLVEAARAKNNPLHRDIYKLGDDDAAFEYRLEIARKVLRSIEVVYEEAPDVPTKAYEVITEPERGDMPERRVYKSTKEILEDPNMRDELLARAIREALTFKRRYSELQELAQVFQALDNFLLNAKA